MDCTLKIEQILLDHTRTAFQVPGGRKTKKAYECEAKKSKVNFHMLRHTFVTRCIENGINPVVLQKILGHSDEYIYKCF